MDTKTSIVTFGNRRIRLDDIISYRIVKKSHTEVVKKTKEEYKRDMERYKRDNSLAKRAGYRVATSAKRVGGGVARCYWWRLYRRSGWLSSSTSWKYYRTRRWICWRGSSRSIYSKE